MPDLDQIFNEARLNADRVELQKKLLGHIVQDEEPILDALPAKQPKSAPPTSGGEGVVELSASKPAQVAPQDVGFVQPENMRSNAEIDANLAQDAKARKPVPGFHEPGLVVGEAVGAAGSGAMTTLEDPRNAWLGLGPIGMAKLAKGGGGLIRDRFQVEGLVERALNPAPLAERITNAINARTAVLTDEEANKQAAALVKSGGVSLETVTNYAPGLAHQSPAHAIAAADVLTKESGHFTDTARAALATEDPLLVDQALTQLNRIINPLASNEGTITVAGQILRRVSSPEIKALQLIAERTSKLTEGMPPLEQLRTIMADAATDPAKQGKALSQSYKQLASHAKELVATGDEAGATLFLNDVKAAIEEEAQLGLFPTDKEVKTAQKVRKFVTEQHIVEANQAAIAKADKDTFKLTPTGPGQPTKPQTDYLKDAEKNTLATIKEHQAQDLRVSEGTSAVQPLSSATKPITLYRGGTQEGNFWTPDINVAKSYAGKDGKVESKQKSFGKLLTASTWMEAKRQLGLAESATMPELISAAKTAGYDGVTYKGAHGPEYIDTGLSLQTSPANREPFKLTPPPGGARPRPMKQHDLLALIAKEPEPEQLALEMAAAVQHPELSKQFLSMIRKAQDAITFGKTEDVGKALQKLQQSLIPPATQATAQPSRMVKTEKDAIRAFFQSIHGKPLSDKEILQAMTMDPGLQPEALVKIVNNLKNPTWRDAGQFFVINNMLTPASDFVNFVASASMIPMHIGARAIGERTGQVAQLLGGKPGVVSGETDAMMHGLFSSFGDSLRLAARVAKTNMPEVGKASLREHALGMNPLSANAMFGYSPTARKLAGIADAANYDSASYPVLSRAGGISAAINVIGVAFGLPGRFMLTGDQFVQAMSMQGEIHALVYRKTVEQAQREGLTNADAWKSYRKFWDQTTAAVPSEIRSAGENFGLEVSLNQNPGIIGQRVMGLRESVNDVTMGVGGTLAAPFYNTLANSVKATWDFAPLAPLSQGASALGRTFGGKTLHSVSQHIRDDMFGADPVKRDLAVGKWALGTTMMTGYVFAALNGRLRGRGPDNKELQAVGYEAYGSPDSVIYNTDTGEGIQVSRIGVHGNLMGMAADLAEVWLQLDDQKKVEGLQLLTTAYVGNLSSDFLQGSLGVAQAVMNGVKRKEDFDILAKTSTALIPGGGMIRSLEKQLQPEDDMLMKDARTSWDKFLARVPGYDTLARANGWEPVPVARSAMFGEAVLQPRSAWGTQAWNPMFLSAPNTKPVIRDTNAIAFRLGMAIQRPAKDVGQDNVPMTNKEYDRYEILAGQFFEERAIGLLPTLKDPTVPDQVKRDKITLHLKDARSTALGVLKGESNDLVEALTATKRDKMTNLHAPRKTTRQAISIGQE